MSEAEGIHLVCPTCLKTNRVTAKRISAHPLCGACKSPLFTGFPVEVNASSFQRMRVANHIPVLVDCWASWCGPCRTMGPEFAKATQSLEPTVRCLKLDTETHSSIAEDLGIRSIPTLLLFVKGREVARISGAQPASEILRWVHTHL